MHILKLHLWERRTLNPKRGTYSTVQKRIPNLFRVRSVLVVELGPAALGGVEPRLHLGGGAGEDDERVDALHGGREVVRLPDVGDVDVVGSPDLLLALLGPHQAPRRELVGSLLELVEHDLTLRSI